MGDRAAAAAYTKKFMETKNPSLAGTAAEKALGSHPLETKEIAEHAWGKQQGAVQPGPDIPKHGGAVQEEIKTLMGPIELRHFTEASAQSLRDSILYQKATGLVPIRMVKQLYIDPFRGQLTVFRHP